jgi:plasmid stabilization system protein ParE
MPIALSIGSNSGSISSTTTPGWGLRETIFEPGCGASRMRAIWIYYRPVRGGIEVVRVVHGARDEHALWRR